MMKPGYNDGASFDFKKDRTERKSAKGKRKKAGKSQVRARRLFRIVRMLPA
jgi:hypothetical protein